MTDKRTLTSPANGAKSKGPKSLAGKAISARNSTRHGLVAQNLVLSRESAARFARILEQMHDRFRPQDPVEAAEVDNMALCRWRQIRIWNVEKSILDNAITSQEGEVANSSNFARAGRAFTDLSKPTSPLAHIARSETRYDRQYTRSLNRLVFLRGQKLLNLTNEPASPIKISDLT